MTFENMINLRQIIALELYVYKYVEVNNFVKKSTFHTKEETINKARITK